MNVFDFVTNTLFVNTSFVLLQNCKLYIYYIYFYCVANTLFIIHYSIYYKTAVCLTVLLKHYLFHCKTVVYLLIYFM